MPDGRAEWNIDHASTWEHFHLEKRQGGKIALKGVHGMYVSAQPDGSVQINRRAAPSGGWEEFTVEDRGNNVVCLKSCHGKYLSAQQNGTAQWNRDHAPRGGWEEIQIEQYRKTSEPILNSDSGMIRGESILVSEHSLPKYNGIYTIQNTEINGKPWFKNNSGCILYFYNANSGGGPSWSLDDRSQDGTNDWFRGGWTEPPNSGGPPLGTRRWEGAGTIKMESVSIPDEDSRDVTPLKTGWYRIENADGSLIERVRVHQDKNHQARNEFIATGDLTGDVMWYVEGNTVKVPKFGSTGTIQADGNVTWDLDGGKAIYEGNSATSDQEKINEELLIQEFQDLLMEKE